jgi:hemerythrin-like domain-containing protein
MEAYLNKGIKEVINQFPEVEDILNEYDIGCAPCMVGTCLLKDIVQIHNLNQDDEQEMMAKIAMAIYPHKEITIPKIKSKNKVKSKEIAYSPPMKKLVDEHVLIKRWVALIPEVIKNLEVESVEGRQLILDGVDFIRTYADKYHHAKEEEILFKYFDEELDILKVMHADHKKGRSHVKAILEALEIKDKAAIAKHLDAYRDLPANYIPGLTRQMTKLGIRLQNTRSSLIGWRKNSIKIKEDQFHRPFATLIQAAKFAKDTFYSFSLILLSYRKGEKE